jgi:hypothetical protein
MALMESVVSWLRTVYEELIIIEKRNVLTWQQCVLSEKIPFFYKMADGLSGVSFLLAPIVLTEGEFWFGNTVLFFYKSFFCVWQHRTRTLLFFLCKTVFFLKKDRKYI